MRTVNLEQSIYFSLMRYKEDGILPGSFLTAVLENDLMGAMKYADIGNRFRMYSICDFIYNEMPIACHGSPEKVKDWVSKKIGELRQ